ncbi:MAG: biotin/lipoyl-binding protein [Eubacterium sp.]|uniref:biotin/lipoyl-binding protein n=1 Tax=Eubacterium ramulus TaxID=39490 RepID=UPI003994935E
MEQKRWGRITVVFFALMVVLTIFSRAASSAVKAHVSVVKASRQKMSHEIQLDGSVEAKNYFLQYVPAGLMVTGVQISAGQQVEAGDVIFTVDVQKVQEKIKAIEAELNRADQKDRLSISRSEASYQDVIKAQKSAYEAVVREQEKQVRAASDAVQQTKEDLNLSNDTDTLREQLDALRTYVENGGVYQAECSGVIGQINVAAGSETVDGIAVMLADAAETVRFTADLSEEYQDEITENSVITLRGQNVVGEEETYEVSSAVVSENTGAETDGFGRYLLTADLPGDLYPVGTKLTVTVDNQSNTYDSCLPLYSLHQKGNNQYFIYVMEEQDTVFGMELVAREVPVTVLDKNEQYVAVEEVISGEVIVSSDKDIADGSRVKIEEE